MRAFTAIDIPAELHDEIRTIQDFLPREGCRLSKPHEFHITLQFLGEIDDAYVEGIKKKLSEIIFNKFSLTINSIGFFPDEKFPKVVWLGLKEHDSVKDLVNIMNQKLDFKSDRRFHAHITLARVKSFADREAFVNRIKAIRLPEPQIKFKVSSFKLIKSELTAEGPIHTYLDEFRLVEL